MEGQAATAVKSLTQQLIRALGHIFLQNVWTLLKQILTCASHHFMCGVLAACWYFIYFIAGWGEGHCVHNEIQLFPEILSGQ